MRALLLPALLLCAGAAQAHFGMVIPSDSMVGSDEGREVTVELSFGHPFEQLGLGLPERPAFHVFRDGTETDLTDTLEPVEVMGAQGWRTTHRLARPGTHVFLLEPKPYWEPAEDAWIEHITKTYVAAYDDDSGWEDPIDGLRAEIVPLTRPFGLWAGNVFRGRVMRGGLPDAHAEVEVEYLNTTGATAPSELMITQTIRADENGVFSYAPPGPGWWGFAALGAAGYTIDQQGAPKPVELGAVLWVHFEEWK